MLRGSQTGQVPLFDSKEFPNVNYPAQLPGGRKRNAAAKSTRFEDRDLRWGNSRTIFALGFPIQTFLMFEFLPRCNHYVPLMKHTGPFFWRARTHGDLALEGRFEHCYEPGFRLREAFPFSVLD